jgi:hypothetical protein
MARQERNNVDYFPHLVTHGKNMYIIDKKYGNDGYVVWFRTLEELGRVDFHHLDLGDETRLLHLASLCNVSEERYLEIITMLVKLGEFDEDLFEKKRVLWDQEFIDSIQDAYRKRVNPCITAEELYKKYEIPFNLPEESLKKEEKGGKPAEYSGSYPQTKLKYSKKEDIVNPYDFWKGEFKKAEKGTQRNRAAYYRIIGTICNEGEYQNALKEPAEHIIAMEKPLAFGEYEILAASARKRGVNILSMIKRIINDPKYVAGKKSLFLLLEDWISKEPIQGTNH